MNAAPANASVLNTSGEFVGIATEMLGAGVPPLMLWIAAHWKPEEHVLHTAGMLQFGAAEVLLAQAQPSREMLEYLFEVAYYILTSGKDLNPGETMDGPKGLLRIETLTGSDTSRRAVILIPVRPN